MKFSETNNTNFFEMDCRVPGSSRFYFLDYQANGCGSKASKILKQNGVRFKFKSVIPIGSFALVEVNVKTSQVKKFEECMAELERVAPFFCDGYHEARVRILDSIVVLN